MSDLDRYQYGYDQNSNRLWKANVVGTAAVGNLDEGYAYDNLNRLTQMKRGTLSGGVITGTPVREMDYTLDPTGNWAAYLTKTSGTTDLNQTRSSSPVNEITAISGTPNWASPPTYDATGNMTSFPQPATPSNAYTATYDAWNRMVSISDTGGTVATYQYDGSNRRIVKVTTAISETRHFYWTNSWQDGEERVGSSTSMDKQFVWGTRYIDELVCRDDATPQRLYATQDANFNLTALVSTSGAVQQRFLYDPYGSSAVLTSSWDSTTDAYEWSTRFTGQFLDTESQVYLYRARYHNPNLGCFLNRDPLEYKGGSNLYSYVNSNPISRVDPNGMQNQNCCWEGTHCCGPDITANLLAMAADVQKQWDNASFFERSRLAIGTIGPEALAAWDIQNLVQGNVQNQNCGGGQASCQNSVTVNGKCYPQTAVNYWIAGLIFAAFDSSWLFRDDAKAFEALLYLYTNAPLGWEYGQQKRI